MSGYVARGISFRTWLFRRLSEVAAERRVSVSGIVNSALVEYLAKDLTGEEADRMRLLAEEDRLLQENQRVFIVTKRILRDGAYVNDAAKSVLLGDENWYERWQKKADGVYERLTKEELDFLLRAFAAREKNSRRIVEIERKLLPSEKLEMGDVEKGWRLPAKEGQNQSQ